MPTLTFTFTTTDESKARIRNRFARWGGFTGDLNDPDPDKQLEIDEAVKQFAIPWLLGQVTDYEYVTRKPALKASIEATNAAECVNLVLT
jgi:hypothetical protein